MTACTGRLDCPVLGNYGRSVHPLAHFARHADPLFFDVTDLGRLATVHKKIRDRIYVGTVFALWLGSEDALVPPMRWPESDIFPEGEDVKPIDVACWYRATTTKYLATQGALALTAWAFGAGEHVIEDALGGNYADLIRQGAKDIWNEPFFNLWARNVSFALPERWKFTGDLRRRLKERGKLATFDLRDPKVSVPKSMHVELRMFAKADHLKRSSEPRRLCPGLKYLNVPDVRAYARIP